MASWGEHRSGRHLSIQVPAEIKIQLIKNKALTGVPIGYQICERCGPDGPALGPRRLLYRDPSRPLNASYLIATRVCVSRRSIVQVSRGKSN